MPRPRPPPSDVTSSRSAARPASTASTSSATPWEGCSPGGTSSASAATHVHTLITLGSPHTGTVMGYALPTRVARQLRPGSAMMRQLAEPVRSCRTRFVAVWSDLDALVLPVRNARLDHPDLAARNVLVHGVGHMSLPSSAAVVRQVVETLAHLDAEGATITAGVTRLTG